ncbi:hypothetical protein OH491_19670 [Termitidicoccus mucosus]
MISSSTSDLPATGVRGNQVVASAVAAKINKLHAKVTRLEKESRRKLDRALMAAWQAGRLLIEAKTNIYRQAGRSSWIPWLETCFDGHLRTAQRYMRLARATDKPEEFAGLSLRQAYFRLGLSIQPNRSDSRTPDIKLPAYITLANKLTKVLRRTRRQIRTSDLAALYAQLCSIFGNENTRQR